MNSEIQSRPVLFFDGECNLCNSGVQFIIRHDKKKVFLFCPLQSERGKEAIADICRQQGKSYDSLILNYRGKYYSRSAAVLQICKLLGGAWQLLYAGIIIPGVLRDPIYNFVSRNRYKWFGKRSSCMIPTPELSSRFI